MWVDTDGEAILFNTSKGRVKYDNILRNPRVAVSVVDSNNPYRLVVLRGTAEFVDGDADAHIDRLAMKYLGADSYPHRREDDIRVIVRVIPD